MDVDALDRAADLAVVLEGAPEDLGRDCLRVDVRQQDGGIVAAELERDPLQILRRGAGDLLARGDGAGEGDLARHRVARHPRAELVAAGDNVDDTGRDDVAQDLAEQDRVERREGRRLDHHRVAGEQRRRDLPDRENQREVPRSDRRDHAERLAADLHPTGLVVLHDLYRNLQTGGVLKPDRGAHDLFAGLGERFALLSGEQRRDALGVRLQRGGAVVEDFATQRFVAAPSGERAAGRLHRFVELGLRAVGYFGECLARRRIDHADPAASRP